MVLLRAFLVSAVLTVAPAASGPSPALAAAPVSTTPPVTANPFIPEDRSITECVSALPKPGCGSEERGGWHQYLVFIALVGGLSVIGWRIIAGVRRGRPALVTAGGPYDDHDEPAGSTSDAPPPPATLEAPGIDRR